MTPSTPDGAAPNPPLVEVPHTPVDSRAAALALTTMKALGIGLKQVDAVMRANADLAFRRQERVPVPSFIDPRRNLAVVQMTNPPMAAEFSDRQAFDQWFMDEHPERCATTEKVTATPARLWEVCKQHAPEEVLATLTSSTFGVPDHEAAAVLKLSAKAGKAVGPEGETDEDAPPGINVYLPDGTARVSLQDGAVEEVMAWLRDGGLALDRLVPPALTAAPDQDADATA